MRILLISDIHSNYRALKAVLEKYGNSAGEIWCLGDIVEYGPCPSECIDLVRRHCRYVVQGNHDKSFAEYNPAAGNPNAWAAYDRDSAKPSDLEYLLNLPTSISVTIDRTSYLLVHGSPSDHLSGALWPHTEASILQETVDSCREDSILCGHTHMAMVLEVGGKTIVNTGTIGQPRDGDYRAQCMLIEDGVFRLERVDYDLVALAHDYERATLPDQIKVDWLRYTRQGIVEVHGLQLGPFSADVTED
ncbi:MAG: metallophosphoesterase family protein [Candidatus Poribacteria bacterium]|nr:metallophosphoesterase family protein [Candidatus Poribacteria bacterium]